MNHDELQRTDVIRRIADHHGRLDQPQGIATANKFTGTITGGEMEGVHSLALQ